MKTSLSATFKLGAISLAFLILGYQISLFIHHSAVASVVANRDTPDTVYIVRNVPSPAVDSVPAAGIAAMSTVRQESVPAEWNDTLRSGTHSAAAKEIYGNSARRRVENFAFNPNTVTVDDLVRLGFSEKQAQSIDNYRSKGGRFRRKSDFAKSYVVSDSVYARLEPYIVIPKTDINKADSAEFDALPGIGGYFASKMVSYREELGGYHCTEQLMDIWHFDEEKYNGLKDLVTCTPAPPYPLWSLPAEELRRHPSIRNFQTARAIVLYRENNGPEDLTVSGLLNAGVISEEQALSLSRCLIAPVTDGISQSAP